MPRTSSREVYPTLQTSMIREQDFTRSEPPRWGTGYPSFLGYGVGRWYTDVEGRSTEVGFGFIPVIPGANDSDGHRSPPLGVANERGGTSDQSYMLRPPKPSADGGQSLGVIS